MAKVVLGQVRGADGVTPSLQVGEVATLPSNQPATVTRQPGSPDSDPVFDFGIPKGEAAENPGDMQSAVYDPQGKEQDVYAYADGVYKNPEFASESTKELYGLGPEAVPDEVLAMNSFIHQYAWQKFHNNFQLYIPGVGLTDATISGTQTAKTTIYYTNSYSIDPLTGVCSYGALSSMSVSYDTYTLLEGLRGEYWSRSNAPNDWTNCSGIYYSASSATYDRTGTSPNMRARIQASLVGTFNVAVSKGLVFSPDPNAYPPAIDDGYGYYAFGKFKDTPPNGNFITGTYTGTGLNASNSQTIELGFAPALLMVFEHRNIGGPGPSVVTSATSAVQYGNNTILALSGTSFAVKAQLNVRPNESSGESVNPYRYIAWPQI